MGFMVGEVAVGQVFSLYFGFPCQALTNCSTLIIIIIQTVAYAPSGLSLVSVIPLSN
jgi:hypothetical protein